MLSNNNNKLSYHYRLTNVQAKNYTRYVMEPTLEGRSKGFSRLETGNLWHRDIEKEPEQTGQDNDPSHTEQATEYTKDTPHRGMTLGMIKSSMGAAMIKVSTVRVY